MSKTDINVTLIGLNRQSVSLGMALRASDHNTLNFLVTGQDGDKKAMEAAQYLGAVDTLQSNARSAVKDADIVLVALPIGVHEAVYEYFAPGLKPGAVVLDLSPMKAPIMGLAERFFPRGEEGKSEAFLVGIKPLVSSKYLFDMQNDALSAQQDLFNGGEMIIAPEAACPPPAVKLANDLAEILGMTPRFMTPEEYDAVADFTERMPSLLGFAMFATMQSAHGRVDLQRAVNPEFATMLRNLRQYEANDTLQMWTERPADTIQRVDELIAILGYLRELLSQSDDEDARTFIKETLQEFSVWQVRRESGKWPEAALDAPAPKGGFFRMLFGGLADRVPKDRQTR